jgi:integrase
MPRIGQQYRLHKASGQAFVSLGGKRVYLGRFGTEESKQRYRLLLADWKTTGQVSTNQMPSAVGASINEVLVEYIQHCESYYVHPDGKQTNEVNNIKRAAKVLKERYGTMDAHLFGPDELVECRKVMIALGWCRRSCNHNTYRVRRVFKWAAQRKLVPPSVYNDLRIVEGLPMFRSPAPEREPIKPVSDDVVDMCLPHMPATVAAMVRLQRLTGMRPAEVVSMKGAHLTMTADVWVYSPPRHKNAWRGKVRGVFLGPKAQEILKPFLKMSLDDFLFDASVHQQLPKPKHWKSQPVPTNGYSVDSYRRAITRACHTAGVPVWGPNRLRHTRGTEVRRQFGLEAASVVLGHARCDVTQVYAEANTERALEIVRQTG